MYKTILFNQITNNNKEVTIHNKIIKETIGKEKMMIKKRLSLIPILRKVFKNKIVFLLKINHGKKVLTRLIINMTILINKKTKPKLKTIGTDRIIIKKFINGIEMTKNLMRIPLINQRKNSMISLISKVLSNRINHGKNKKIMRK